MQTKCPDKATLRKFVAQKLYAAEAIQVEQHVTHCDRCYDTVDELRLSESPSIEETKSFNLLDQIKGDARSIPYRQTNFKDFEIKNKYWVGELIDQGATGAVYEGKNLQLGNKKVAIKVLKSSPAFLERFENEKYALAKLNHPGIVAAYDAGEFVFRELTFNFLVMELVEGPNLAQVVDHQGPIPWRQTCEILKQIAEALVNAADSGMIHRDIKPSNILIRESDSKVKIVDWGLVKIVDDSAADMTRTGAVVGTLDFLAPEQAENARNVSIKADIYSLCCTVFFLLTGRTPYSHVPVNQKLEAHKTGPLPDMSELPESVPQPLTDLIRSGLAKDPHHRPTPAEFLSCISQVVRLADKSRYDEQESQAHLVRKPSFTRSRRKRAVLIAAVVAPLLLLLGTIIKLALPGEGELVIEVPDGVELELRITQSDGETKNIVVTKDDVPGAFKIRSGPYEIAVIGADVNRFEISNSRAVLKKNETVLVRVSRTLAVPNTDFELAKRILKSYPHHNPQFLHILHRDHPQDSVTVVGENETIHEHLTHENLNKFSGDIRLVQYSGGIPRPEDLHLVSEMKYLKRLQLVGVFLGTDRPDWDWDRLPRGTINSFTHYGNLNSDKFVEFLSGCPIESLELGSNYSQYATLSDDYFGKVLLACPNVEVLHLNQMPLNAKALENLGNLKRLQVLGINNCDLSDDALEIISKIETLRELHLDFNNFTDAGISKVANCKKLRVLSIAGEGITGTCLANLRQLPILESLGIGGPGLAPENLGELSDYPSLNSLEFKCAYQVDDTQIERLAKIRRLQKLILLYSLNPNVPSTGITEQGIVRLRKMAPRLSEGIKFTEIANDLKFAVWVLMNNGSVQLAGDKGNPSEFSGVMDYWFAGVGQNRELKSIDVSRVSIEAFPNLIDGLTRLANTIDVLGIEESSFNETQKARLRSFEFGKDKCN